MPAALTAKIMGRRDAIAAVRHRYSADRSSNEKVRPMTTTLPALRSAAALLMLLVTGRAQAQANSVAAPASTTEFGAAPGCLQSIPRESMTRVPVFASLAMRDSLRYEIPPSAGNMLQAVADRITGISGTHPGTLPPGEPEITWDSLGRSLAITWHRDGKLAWRVWPDTGARASAPAKAALLFGRALDSAQANGETFMIWPEGLSDDSLEMLVDFRRATVDGDGGIVPVRARAAVPLFTVAAPREKPVRVVQQPRTFYPPLLQSQGVIGRVMMEFVVDTTGHADVATIHDVWPRERPALTGALGAHYKELVHAARLMVRDTRFAPAEVGRCKVRQVVQQPFTWDFPLAGSDSDSQRRPGP